MLALALCGVMLRDVACSRTELTAAEAFELAWQRWLQYQFAPVAAAAFDGMVAVVYDCMDAIAQIGRQAVDAFTEAFKTLEDAGLIRDASE